MQKVTFTDNSYIEKNKVGLMYVGILANEAGHIIRKNDTTLELYIKALKSIDGGELIIKQII